MSFLQDTIDFFSGSKTAHMGAHQYTDHSGSRNGTSMSGSRLWDKIESSELENNSLNIFNSEEHLIKNVAADLSKYIPENTPLLEMGPGTISAFQKKSLPILTALKSKDYACVDQSTSFLKDFVGRKELNKIKYTPIKDDFFEENGNIYTDKDQTLLCMSGSTIGNIPAPLSTTQPKEHLSNNLKLLANRIKNGWLLLSFDSDQNEERNINYYNKHIDFHLNIFDRMVSELKITGNFSADAFSYKGLWIEKSSQFAHMAIANKDLNFSIDDRSFILKKGQAFHIKNSYKFLPLVFAASCRKAGLKIVKTWENTAQKNIWLLEKATNSIPSSSLLNDAVPQHKHVI